jgi:hypothetical protein
MLGIAGNNTVISGPEIDNMSEERLRGVRYLGASLTEGRLVCRLTFADAGSPAYDLHSLCVSSEGLAVDPT